MIRGAVILIFFNLYVICYSQAVTDLIKADSACLSLIRQAEENYNNGLYLDCLEIIEKVLSRYDLDRSDKINALELAAKASVEIGEMGKADSYVNVLLKTFPHYDLKEEANSESFNRLVRKYNVHPAMTIGVRNTADWMNYRTISIFSYDGLQYDAPYLKRLQGILNGFGLMYYGWAELQFDRDISLNGDMTFKWTSYVRELTKGEPYELNLWEQDNFMEITMYAKRYFHPWRNVLTYGAAGLGWLYMTQCTGNVSIYYPAADSGNSTGNINFLPFRNRSTFEWLIGAGIGYKYRNLRMFFDARYYGGLNSITNPAETAGNSILVNDYHYLDNKVRINQFELGASISYTFVNSVRKKKQ